MISHPDEHVFTVAERHGRVHISCQMCAWHTNYPIGDEGQRMVAKTAAQQHNADQLFKGRRKTD